MNQTSCAGSPHEQVNVFAGCPDHTCHHKTTAGTANNAMTTTWKPTLRTTLTATFVRAPGVGEEVGP